MAGSVSESRRHGPQASGPRQVVLKMLNVDPMQGPAPHCALPVHCGAQNWLPCGSFTQQEGELQETVAPAQQWYALPSFGLQMYGPTGSPTAFVAGAQQPAVQSAPVVQVGTQAFLPEPSTPQACFAPQHTPSHGSAHAAPSFEAASIGTEASSGEAASTPAHPAGTLWQHACRQADFAPESVPAFACASQYDRQ